MTGSNQGAKSFGMKVAILLIASIGASANAIELMGVPPNKTDQAWECWVSLEWQASALYSLRCIRDTGGGSANHSASSPSGALLDHVRAMIQRGETQEIDEDIERGLMPELHGQIWKLRMFQYPYEDAWAERLPHKQVQDSLCGPSRNCKVSILR